MFIYRANVQSSPNPVFYPDVALNVTEEKIPPVTSREETDRGKYEVYQDKYGTLV